MGVPGFFIWLLKNYKKEGFVINKTKLENNDLLNEINNIDYFLIDANCLIHPVCFKVIADNPDLNDNDKLENISKVFYTNHLDIDIVYEFEGTIAKYIVENLKICKECKENKQLKEYKKCNTSIDKHLNTCIKCYNMIYKKMYSINHNDLKLKKMNKYKQD